MDKKDYPNQIWVEKIGSYDHDFDFHQYNDGTVKSIPRNDGAYIREDIAFETSTTNLNDGDWVVIIPKDTQYPQLATYDKKRDSFVDFYVNICEKHPYECEAWLTLPKAVGVKYIRADIVKELIDKAYNEGMEIVADNIGLL